MTTWNTIEELRNILLERYTDSKLNSELEKACSEEYELKTGYNGRQILELLQNVDDAISDSKESASSEVNIVFKDDILIIENSGTKFSHDTIERLCLGRASSKSSENIGNKGTGFRSLLNDSEWVEVHSGDFSIKFSYEYAKECLEESLKEEKVQGRDLLLKQQQGWKKNYPFCFPIMNCPEQIGKLETQFDTVIRVKIKKENYAKAESIKDQLKQPFYKSLLFLPNIEKITLDNEGDKTVYEKVSTRKNGYENVLIFKEHHGDESKAEEYWVFRKDSEIKNGKKGNLVIAIPGHKKEEEEQYDFEKEKLYCYFPIRNVPTPIHALIHGPFETNSSRDDLINDPEQINLHVFKALIPFIKETAEILRENYNEIQVNPAEFVAPLDISKHKMWDKESYNLKDVYFDALCDSKIIKNINGDFLSVNDAPVFLEEYPDEFKGKGFEKVVNKETNDKTISFIKECAKHKSINTSFNPNLLVKVISEQTSQYTNEQCVKILFWWSKYYKTQEFLPALLKDTRGKWIDKSKKVFLPTSEGVSTIDEKLSWVELCVLKQEYVDLIINRAKETDQEGWREAIKDKDNPSDKRILDSYSDMKLAVSFKEQSSSRVIVSEISRQVDNVEKAKAFINWFFENYKDKTSDSSELAKITVFLPNNKNEIKDASKLYLGDEYGNQLGTKLFENTEFDPLCSLETLYDGEDKEGFIRFISLFGVRKYPKLQKMHIPGEDRCINNVDYFKHVESLYNIKEEIRSIETETLPNLLKLLSSMTKEEVSSFLANDSEITNLLISDESGACIKAPKGKIIGYYSSSEYLKFVFNNLRWIDIDGKKYSPNKILKYPKLKDFVDGYYGISEKDLIKQLGSEKVATKLGLGFKETFADFSDDEIKTFLEKLPSFDKGEISRKIYMDIIKGKANVLPTYNNEGFKLLAKDGEFHPAAELIYVDKTIPVPVEKNEAIDIPIKQGTETIKNWLNVKKIELDIALLSYTEIAEPSDFEKEMKDIKVVMLSIIETQKSFIPKIQRLKVVACSRIEAKRAEEDDPFDLEDYAFISGNSSTFYIKLPSNNISEIRKNDSFIESIIEIFRESITVSVPADTAEILISKETEGKKIKIQERYGVDKWKESSDLLFAADDCSNKISTFFKENGLEQEDLEKISKMTFLSGLLEDDYSILIECLKKIGKDVSDINQLDEGIHLDVTSYFRNKCKELRDKKRDIYKSTRYNLCKEQAEEREKYLEELRRFNGYEFLGEEIQNSINNDPSTIIKSVFPTYVDIVEDISKEIDDKYNENIKNIIKSNDITEDNLEARLDGKIDIKSLLYFDLPNERITEFVNNIKNEEIEAANSNRENTTTNETIIETSTIDVRLEHVDSKQGGTHHRDGELSKNTYKKQNERNEKAGEQAEKLAYQELKKTCPNLIWCSKYSPDKASRNNLPPNNIVCDMWNQSNEGNQYFEVKSFDGTFEMSKNEYESMRKNKKNYFVVLVKRESGEVMKLSFKEIDVFKEPSHYSFRFKVVDKNQ